MGGNHPDNPVLNWCAANAVVRLDPAGHIKPDRSNSGENIRGIVPLTIGVGRWMAKRPRAVGGGGAGGRAVRARNAVSVVPPMEGVVRKARKPMRVGEITEKVLAGGYRSTSPQFRAIVNQMLIKEKRFVSAGRGIYRLKK